MKKITIEDYENALTGKIIYTSMNIIRSHDHELYTESIIKKVLDSNDEKRVVLEDGINTVPYGFKN